MNGDQKRHYDKAHRLLAQASGAPSHIAQRAYLLEAQVHATLAIAARDIVSEHIRIEEPTRITCYIDGKPMRLVNVDDDGKPVWREVTS